MLSLFEKIFLYQKQKHQTVNYLITRSLINLSIQYHLGDTVVNSAAVRLSEHMDIKELS